MTLIGPLLFVVALLFGTIALNSVWHLSRNYAIARKMGVPIRVIPICHTNPLWTLIDRRVLSIFRCVPFIRNSSFTRYNFRGWEMADRCKSHDELGLAYVLVSPRRIWLYIADPEALMEVFRRRIDFPRCLELTEILNVFGPNISTVDGAEWKVQRKMTATCFNDQNNQIVWAESLYLAKDMLEYWTSKSAVDSVAHDTRTLSLHVLSRAGFGKSFKFEGHDQRSESSPSSSYKNSLQTILENCVLIMVLGPKFLEHSRWLPNHLNKLREACSAFQHMEDRNLMTSLVRASQGEAESGGPGLTEAEIYGNMFVFNFAGHDTTAHTFTFAIYFLAAHPKVQDWLSEEVQHVSGNRDIIELDYSVDFPQLKRCLSVMLETLRLYTPVPVAKWTDTRAQSLKIGERNVLIPPETMVIPSYAAVQADPKYWGLDSLTWRPSRWIETDAFGQGNSNTEVEKIVSPQRGTFLGWSEGARDCVGRKFSQVEFVATLATLVRDWYWEPVINPGETLEIARERVARQIETDSSPVLLLQMLHPERSPLVWRKR
ncbi:cytochrome P450 [Xylariaceae sp. FL1272]|nr:cytochrome P450 [Xylariaceae sp. FL1272]